MTEQEKRWLKISGVLSVLLVAVGALVWEMMPKEPEEPPRLYDDIHYAHIYKAEKCSLLDFDLRMYTEGQIEAEEAGKAEDVAYNENLLEHVRYRRHQLGC